MSTAKSGKVSYESGQTYHDYAAAVDSGDHKIFTVTGASVYSGFSGKEVSVRPNGIYSGRDLLSVDSTNDTVAYAAFSAYSEGVLRDVVAGTETITRPATDVSKVNSLTMTDAGAIAMVAGVDGATTAFSTDRGEAGAPPFIPVDSVEIGQIRVTTAAAGAIASTEIFQVVGTHVERFDHPTFSTNNVGEGESATVPAQKYAHVKFDDEIDNIHTGDAYKKVYVAYYDPIFAEFSKSLDFVPAENTHSLTSTQYYNGTTGSVSSTLGQGTLTVLLDDAVTDTIVRLKDALLTLKFWPDRNKTAYILTQGTVGLTRSFPVDDQVQASLTISAEDPSAEFAS